MSLIISDTSPLQYLIQIDATGVIPRLFGQIVVPTAVIAELRDDRAPADLSRWALHPPTWVSVRRPAKPVLSRLGAGEREAIALALEIRGSAILMDDRRGKRVASQHGVKTIGTITVLEMADVAGIARIDETLAKLAATNFYAAPEVMEAALARARRRRGV